MRNSLSIGEQEPGAWWTFLFVYYSVLGKISTER